jgi:hypothetical protein
MKDSQAKNLDLEIIHFIRAHIDLPAPEKAFEALAFKIFEYQFENSANYRHFCEAEGKNPGRLKSWKEIPAMPAMGFKELVLATFPIKKAVRVFKTSGTTGEICGAHFFDTLKLYRASAVPTFKKYLLPDKRKIPIFCLMASPKEARSSSLSWMMGLLGGEFYFKNGKALFDLLEAKLAKTRGPVVLCATAFLLKAFLDGLSARKIFLKLPPGSRLMETGGFKGKTKEISKQALYRLCDRHLGIPKDFCVSEYGMTELSSQFYDTTLRDKIFKIKREPFKEGPAWTRTLVMDPRTGVEVKKGKVGVLRHFDLANRGSVMAVQTEDLGRAKGDGFELLGRAPKADLRGCSLSYEEFLAR